MTITNGYASLSDVKAEDVLNITTVEHDPLLEVTIEAVSRAIDNYCGRRFYQVSENQYYTPEDGETLYVNDIGTTSSLSVYTDEDGDGTFEVTWTSDDYNLAPYNALLNNEVYNMIETAAGGSYSFPTVKRSTKIFAFFGWASVPKPIRAACILWTARLFKRYVTPLGASAMTALGEMRMQIPEFDGDIKQMLAPYVRFA
jgi:hypothetical protein